MKTYIVTFEDSKYGFVRHGTATARNPLAGLARAARAAGLIAKRNKGSHSWNIILAAFGFSSASQYIVRSGL